MSVVSITFSEGVLIFTGASSDGRSKWTWKRRRKNGTLSNGPMPKRIQDLMRGKKTKWRS